MALAFSFTPQQRLLQRSARDFLRTEVAPHLPEDDWSGHGGTDLELVGRLQRMGYFGLPVPRELDGAGCGEVGYCLVNEELGGVDASLGTVMGAHTGIGLMPVYLFGNEEQRDRYVRPLASGKAIGAFALTEPTAGSDAASIKTTARRDGSDWILDGTKIWCSNGNFADTVVAFAVTDASLGAHGGVTAFILEKGMDGLKVGTIEDKLGIRHSDTAELVLDGCRVPGENVLGKVGEGFIVALTVLDGGRVGLAAATLGATQRLLDDCLERVRRRRRRGAPVGDAQSIQWRLADMEVDIHLARYAVYHAAELVQRYYDRVAAGEPVPRSLREQVSRAAAVVKVHCSEMAGRAGEAAIHIHGADGIRSRYRVERAFRDQIITEIYEGTNEIQRMIIARELLQQGAPL